MPCPKEPKLNLLKGSYSGKLGDTVGYEQHGEAMVREYTKSTDPATESQLKNRDVFSEMNEYVSWITDEIADKVTFNEDCRSTRNNIVKLNKEQFKEKLFNPPKLVLNDGNLPTVKDFAANFQDGIIYYDYIKPIAGNLSKNAEIAILAVDRQMKKSASILQKMQDENKQLPIDWKPSGDLDIYYWTRDNKDRWKRGSKSQTYTIQGGN